MATHSNILAWEIPWTEEPSKLQSMGSQRVRHCLVIKQQQSLEISGVLGLFVCLSFPFVLNKMGVIKFTSALKKIKKDSSLCYIVQTKIEVSCC